MLANDYTKNGRETEKRDKHNFVRVPSHSIEVHHHQSCQGCIHLNCFQMNKYNNSNNFNKRMIVIILMIILNENKDTKANKMPAKMLKKGGMALNTFPKEKERVRELKKNNGMQMRIVMLAINDAWSAVTKTMYFPIKIILINRY